MTQPEVQSEQRAELITTTALRIVVGVIMATHGAMKLSDPAATVQSFAHIGIPYPGYAVYFAIAGEFLGGIGLAVGLLTRIAALGILCSMAVAIGYVHLGHGLMAEHGGWEYPVTLALVALFFITHGAGALSIDALFARPKGERRHGYRAHRVRSYA